MRSEKQIIPPFDLQKQFERDVCLQSQLRLIKARSHSAVTQIRLLTVAVTLSKKHSNTLDRNKSPLWNVESPC